MTTITLTTALAGHNAGDTINVTPGAAAFLTDNGYAEPNEPAKSKARGKGKTPTDTSTNSEVGGDSPADPATTAG